MQSPPLLECIEDWGTIGRGPAGRFSLRYPEGLESVLREWGISAGDGYDDFGECWPWSWSKNPSLHLGSFLPMGRATMGLSLTGDVGGGMDDVVADRFRIYGLWAGGGG